MRPFSLILLTILLAGCATRPIPMAVPKATIDDQLSAIKARLFVLVEAEREHLNNGAKPLILDPELMHAAQVHSDDMAMKNSFDVENPEGNVAVNALLNNPKFRGFVGENSAAQYFTPGVPMDPQVFASGFLKIWENSPDHRMNMDFPGFDRTGIGLAVSGNTIYAAELFATDLGLPEPQ